MRSHPADKVEDVGVPPHPTRESLEPGEGLYGIGVPSIAANKTVDPIGIRPVGFYSDRRKALFRD